jgi:hypothetical protein
MTPALLELDGMVVNIELTLASIIQGVALYFLTENTRGSLALPQSVTWIYVLCGLVVIFIFWSRSIIHTLTLIRWPLEFGHNFLYIGCALGEALLFTRVTNPVGWFEITAIYAAGVWFLFLYDLRRLRPREADLASSASRALFALIERDQHLNLWFLIPGLFVYALVSIGCLKLAPDFLLHRPGHGWLALGQLITLAAYLYYVIRFFARIAPLILQRQEERRALAAQSGKS